MRINIKTGGGKPGYREYPGFLGKYLFKLRIKFFIEKPVEGE